MTENVRALVIQGVSYELRRKIVDMALDAVREPMHPAYVEAMRVALEKPARSRHERRVRARRARLTARGSAR